MSEKETKHLLLHSFQINARVQHVMAAVTHEGTLGDIHTSQIELAHRLQHVREELKLSTIPLITQLMPDQADTLEFQFGRNDPRVELILDLAGRAILFSEQAGDQQARVYEWQYGKSLDMKPTYISMDVSHRFVELTTARQTTEQLDFNYNLKKYMTLLEKATDLFYKNEVINLYEFSNPIIPRVVQQIASAPADERAILIQDVHLLRSWFHKLIGSSKSDDTHQYLLRLEQNMAIKTGKVSLNGSVNPKSILDITNQLIPTLPSYSLLREMLIATPFVYEKLRSGGTTGEWETITQKESYSNLPDNELFLSPASLRAENFINTPFNQDAVSLIMERASKSTLLNSHISKRYTILASLFYLRYVGKINLHNTFMQQIVLEMLRFENTELINLQDISAVLGFEKYTPPR
jgi:hypothetical protein